MKKWLLLLLPAILACSTRVEWQNELRVSGEGVSIRNVEFGGVVWSETLEPGKSSSQKKVGEDYGQVSFEYERAAAGWTNWTPPERVSLEAGGRNVVILGQR